MKRALKKILKLVFYFSASLLILISIVLIISQTESFRVFIHDRVEAELRKSLGGEIYLGRFYGNIFTGLGVDGFYIKVDGQNFLKALRAELKYNPIGLIKGSYSFQELVIYKPEVYLIRGEDGRWNFQKVFKPRERGKGRKFSISFDKFIIDDGKFALIDLLHRPSSLASDSLDKIDFHNFVVHDINAVLSGGYAPEKINLKNFKISFIVDDDKLNAQIKGKFYADRRELKAEDIEISTGGSKIKFDFDVSTKDNLFKLDKNTIANVHVNVSLVADSFSFNELAKFIPAVHFLSGSSSIEIEAEGTLKALKVNKIRAKVYDSDIFLTGELKNVTRFSEFFIDAEVKESKINLPDIPRFVTFVKMPNFKIGKIDFNGVYRGHPLDFNSSINLRWAETNVNVNGKFKIKGGFVYDLSFNVSGLNPEDILGREDLKGLLSFSGSVNGSGTKFETSFARASVEIEQSYFGKFLIPKSSFWFELSSGELNGSFVSLSQGLRGVVDMNLKKDDEKFVLSLSASLSDLDISELRVDKPNFLRSHISGNLNVRFNLGKTNLVDLSAELNPSTFGNYRISRLRLNARYSDKGSERNLNVYSNMFDLNLGGEFNFDDLAKSLSLVAKTLNLKIDEKLNFAEAKEVDFSEVKNPVSVEYKVRLKNLTPISVFSIGEIFQAVGDLKGSFYADSQGFYLYGDVNLKNASYLRYKDGRVDTTKVDNFKGEFDILFEFDRLKFGLTGAMKNFASKSFGIDSAGLSLKFDDTQAYFESSVKAKNLNFEFILISQFGRDVNKFILKDISGEIYGNKISISDEVEVFQTKSGFVINPAVFVLNGQKIYLSGFVDKQTQQVRLWSENFKLDKLAGVTVFSGDVDFSIFVYGTHTKPNSEIEISVKNFKYKEAYLGEFKCFGNVTDEIIDLTSSLVTDVGDMRYEAMDLHLSVPMWFNPNVREKYPNPYVFGSVKLLRFPLALFEPLIKYISELRGDITGEIDFEGTFDKPKLKGSFSLQNCAFKFNPNKKYYIAYGTGRIDSNVVYIDDFNLWNNPDDYKDGEAQINGKIYLKGFSIAEANLNISGKLLIVGKEGYGTTGIYGRVIAETGNGGLNLKIDTSGYYLGGEILLADVDVNRLVERGAGTSVGGGFEYVYVGSADTTEKEEVKSEELVYFDVPIKIDTSVAAQVEKKTSKFNYDLKISTSKNAKLNLILNTQTGEEFFADFSGNLNIREYSGSTSAYGVIEISDRSYYNFFKRFNAKGMLRFVGDLKNPELDITASYTGTHTALTDTLGSGKVETVQITLSITGTLSKPVIKVQMYVDGEDYHKVYPHGDVETDAISFLVTGRFKDELTRGEATMFTESLWSSAGASLLSSAVSGVITDVLRDVLGGFIVSTELGYYSGFKGLRITGSTGGAIIQLGGDIFTDISRLSVVVRYPLLRKFLGGNLSVEYERKPVQFYQEKEIVNKLGFYYRIRL